MWYLLIGLLCGAVLSFLFIRSSLRKNLGEAKSCSECPYKVKFVESRVNVDIDGD